MSIKKNSEHENLIIETKLGNTLKIQVSSLDDGDYEVIVNGDGYILNKDEFGKICKYVSKTTS
jgi:hypothetical protein